MMERPSTRRRILNQRLGFTEGPEDQTRMFLIPGPISWLIGIMVGIFILQSFGPVSMANKLDYFFGFIPSRLTRGLMETHNIADTIMPLIGHIFLHANIPHIVFNSLWLVIFGTGVARRMGVEGQSPADGIYNTILFLIFFILSGIAGGLTFYLLRPESAILLVGASGAISGLMGGAMRFALRRYTPYGVAHGPLSSVFDRPVLLATIVYVGINLLTAIGAVGGGEGLSIAWDAHIGGYLFGLFAFPFFDRLARKSHDPFQVWQ